MANAVPAPRANIGVCLTGEEVFGRRGNLSLGECRRLLAQYNFVPVIHRLAMLKHANERVFGDEPVTTVHQLSHVAAALQMLLTESERNRIFPECVALARSVHFFPFSNQAIVAAMELAGVCCNRRAGRDLPPQGQGSDLGRVLFALQGATLSEQFRTRLTAQRDFNAITDVELGQLVRNHLAHNGVQNFGSCIGRFFAYLTEPNIRSHFEARARRTVDDWFRSAVGMGMDDYVRAALLVGAVACRFQEANPSWQDLIFSPARVLSQLTERDRENVRRLLKLAVQTPAEIGAGRAPDEEISDFVYSSFSVTVRPLVRLPDYWLPLSQNLVLEKYLAGIPHLLDESIRARGETNIEGTRGPFGYLLERYLGLLFERWFDGAAGLRVITNYRYREGPLEPEGDILLVAGASAFVFEVKAKVSTLGLRSEGAFEPMSRMLKEPALQAMRVAEAVARGDARAPDGTAITGITQVYPCAVIYGRVPLRSPMSERFERHLETATGRTIFTANGALMPLQYFDLDTIEAWEDALDLSDVSVVLAYLASRSTAGWLRHGRQFPESDAPRPRTPNGPHQRFIAQGQEYVEALRNDIGPSQV